ncbi:MAG: GAF domain-containing protein [Alcanivoracaceae bacterium]|jgi:HAMP domain-containing protein|nr:GAF domain-containing protein [Alcanivoracaceae bacterium]
MPVLSIKHQLRVLILLVVSLLAAIWLINRHYQQQAIEGHEARTQLAALELGLTALRREERDFIADKDEQHIATFTALFADYISDIVALREQMQSLGLDDSLFGSLEPAMLAYRDSFETLVAKQRDIGLDHESGLYGALRQAAHDMEKVVENDPSLYAPLLLIRRHEKDFMLRRDNAYYTRFMSALSNLRGHLMLSDLDFDTLAKVHDSLRAYEEAFDTLSQQERDIGLKQNQGLLGAMGERIAEAEAAFAGLRDQLQVQLDQHIRQSVMVSTVIVVSVMAVLTLILMLLARDLGRRLQRTVNSASALGAGDWDSAIETDRKDELGAVLAALESMRLELIAKTARIEADGRLKNRQAELAGVLQGVKEVDALSEDVIRYLTPTLQCQVGTLYLLDGEQLTFAAGYGVESAAIRQRSFEVGEGLIGQCVHNRKLMRVRNVPADYLSILSGTGSSSPGTLLISPLIWNGQLFGAVELGSLGEPDKDAEALLELMSEAIAIALNAALVRVKMAKVLEEAWQKTELLEKQKQETEAARQILEEQAAALQASEEELRVQQEELQAQQEELRVTNEELEAQTRLLMERTRQLEQQHSRKTG